MSGRLGKINGEPVASFGHTSKKIQDKLTAFKSALVMPPLTGRQSLEKRTPVSCKVAKELS